MKEFDEAGRMIFWRNQLSIFQDQSIDGVERDVNHYLKYVGRDRFVSLEIKPVVLDNNVWYLGSLIALEPFLKEGDEVVSWTKPVQP